MDVDMSGDPEFAQLLKKREEAESELKCYRAAKKQRLEKEVEDAKAAAEKAKEEAEQAAKAAQNQQPG